MQCAGGQDRIQHAVFQKSIIIDGAGGLQTVVGEEAEVFKGRATKERADAHLGQICRKNELCQLLVILKGGLADVCQARSREGEKVGTLEGIVAHPHKGRCVDVAGEGRGSKGTDTDRLNRREVCRLK